MREAIEISPVSDAKKRANPPFSLKLFDSQIQEKRKRLRMTGSSVGASFLSYRIMLILDAALFGRQYGRCIRSLCAFHV